MNCPRCGCEIRDHDLLTPTETRVVELLAERGLSYREVGAQLNLAEQSVKNYVSRAIRKLGLKSRVELAVLWRTEIFQIGLSA